MCCIGFIGGMSKYAQVAEVLVNGPDRLIDRNPKPLAQCGRHEWLLQPLRSAQGKAHGVSPFSSQGEITPAAAAALLGAGH